MFSLKVGFLFYVTMYIKMTETFNTHFLALNKEPFKNNNFFS